MKRFLGLLIGVSVLLGNNPANADEINCGSLHNGFGPYDFRYQFGEPKRLVESAHFPPYVESLLRGRTADAVGGDIDYTLRAFPNHHRALLSMMNLATRERTGKPPGSRFSVECWLDRAERFAPDDGMVKVLWATWLIKQGNKAEAEEKLAAGIKQAPEMNTNFDYSVGLAYFDLKRYDLALAAAHRAYRGGFPLPGLKQKLMKAGQWRDPPPLPAPTQTPDNVANESQEKTAPTPSAE
ncbi:tetratricopeptide repeat protein [Chitinimonas sp. PSY-7]|uniref:tetratricopeptide repeat protein n=1 Tax=Chitinimonas sp. PSY-7 TaxID=3459088 RepID=UPI00403FF9A8